MVCDGALAARNVPSTAVVAGEDTQLFCPVYGYPIDSVKWEKDSKLLPLRLRQVVFKNGTLLIKKVQRKVDSGDYDCTAANKLGQVAKARLSVRVLGRNHPLYLSLLILTEGIHSWLCTRVDFVVSSYRALGGIRCVSTVFAQPPRPLRSSVVPSPRLDSGLIPWSHD